MNLRMCSNLKTFIFLFTTYRSKIPELKATMTSMPSHKHVEERYNDIIKSQNDNRLYRGLILANKMKVLLISDPTTDKAAVALDVNIGNF